MKLMQNLYKVFSYLFISFIVILITLTFGMPDFISSSANPDRYLAARVGDEIITRRQLSQTRENYMRQRFKGQDLPENFRKQVEDQVFDHLIQNKVRLILMKDIAFYPIHRSKNRVMANYLMENFPSYFKKTTQEFDKFEQEVLRRNQVSYSELETDVVDGYAIQYGNDLFDAIQSFSDPEKILIWDSHQIQISYQVGVLSKEEKKKILKSRVVIPEKDIQKKFKDDYLSKDKKAQLTKVKREAIQNSLYKKREKEAESELLKEMKSILKKKSIRHAASRYGVQVHNVRDVNLSSELNEKKEDAAPSFDDLGRSKAFREFLTFSKENEANVIVEKGAIYFINILKKKVPTNRQTNGALKKRELMKTLLKDHEEEFSGHADSVSERYKAEVTEMINEIQKQRVNIKRSKDLN